MLYLNKATDGQNNTIVAELLNDISMAKYTMPTTKNVKPGTYSKLWTELKTAMT